jgi:hypothetical protein
MRTFLEKILVMGQLELGYESGCLIHPKYLHLGYHEKRQVYCTSCLNQYISEVGQMAGYYLLVISIGLPRELARCIMWFVMRV